jgi:hypothetical protein
MIKNVKSFNKNDKQKTKESCSCSECTCDKTGNCGCNKGK